MTVAIGAAASAVAVIIAVTAITICVGLIIFRSKQKPESVLASDANSMPNTSNQQFVELLSLTNPALESSFIQPGALPIDQLEKQTPELPNYNPLPAHNVGLHSDLVPPPDYQLVTSSQVTTSKL